MILRDALTILHRLPPSPRADLIARLPDPLAPDYVFHIVSSTIVHDPFRDLTAGYRSSLVTGCQHSTPIGNNGREETYTSGIRAHEINGFAAAMVTRGAITVGSIASSALDSAVPSRDYPFRTINGDLLALLSSGGWTWVRITPKALRGGLAAFERGRTRTLVRQGLASAVTDPTTVSGASTACRLAAAFDVGRVLGAAVVNGDAAFGLAGGFLDADAWVNTQCMLDLMRWCMDKPATPLAP